MFTTSTGRVRPTWAFVISVVFSFAAFFIAGVVSESIAGQHYLVLEVLFRTLLVLLLLGIYVWLLTIADNIHHHRIAALGLPVMPGWGRQFALGCVVGLVLTAVAVMPAAIWGNPSVHFHFSVYLLPRTGTVLFVLVVGAIGEELIFRGYPFQHLEQGIGAVGAIAVFSVLFGAVHLSNPGASRWGLVNTVLIGILLSIAYLRTRALWLPWGIHFGWNTALGFLCGLPVSGLRMFNVLVRTSASGPAWMTGGSYGIEASAPGTVAVLIGLVLVWKLPVTKSSGQGPVASLPLAVEGHPAMEGRDQDRSEREVTEPGDRNP
jgi:membrane protease YdiL (CAAX protease family)